MIEIGCPCGATLRVGEDRINEPTTCDGCGASTTYACAEVLPPCAGAGDFDVALIVRSGPARAGTQVALGGVADIGVGKADGKLVQLLGHRVSRNHATISRVDFGPGRWAIRDHGSTNGTFVNGTRLGREEPFTLSIGDRVDVGDFEFEVRDASPVAVAVASDAPGGVAAVLEEPFDGFDIVEEPATKPPLISRTRPVVEAAPVGPAKPCKRCKAMLAPGAKFCTGCGTDVATGKRAVLSKDIDENQLYITTESIVGPLSFLLRLGLFPIASVALGAHKPIATWTITGLTALCSILFMFGASGADEMEDISPGTANLMLWSGQPLAGADAAEVEEARPWTDAERARARRSLRRMSPRASDREIAEAVREMEAEAIADRAAKANSAEAKAWREQVGFKPYQLVTHAFLHDFTGWIPMILHFGGNLLFLLVFGLRVNELIGQWRFAVSYLLLAIGAGVAQHVVSSNGPAMPMVGASGAIMGLAGMYLVLFPRQKVYMVFWARLGLLTGFKLIFKIWQMPGFWLLVAWVAWNDGVPILVRHLLKLPDTGGVGHWAHVGGFGCGVALALVWLLSRQVHAHGHDLISNLFGPRAAGLVRQG